MVSSDVGSAQSMADDATLVSVLEDANSYALSNGAARTRTRGRDLREARHWPFVASVFVLLDRMGTPRPLAFQRQSW